MNIHCGIVRDLLPLYTEHLCGEESRLAVDEHLNTCADCRKALQDISVQDSTPSLEALPLQTLSRKLKARQIRLIALALCLAMFLVTVWTGRSMQVEPLSYSPELSINIRQNEQGDFVVQYDNSLSPASIEGVPIFNEGDQVSFMYSLMFRKADDLLPIFLRSLEGNEGKVLSTATEPITELILQGHGDLPVKIYYANPRSDAVLLYSAPELLSEQDNGGLRFLPRLALNYYLILMAGLLVIIGLLYLAFLFLKWPKTKRVLMYLSFLPLSYMLAHFAIKGMNGTSWEMLMDLRYILLATAFAGATMALTATHLHEKRKCKSKP